MSMTFEEAKNQVANKYGYDQWTKIDWFKDSSANYRGNTFFENEAADLYAQSKAAQAWEEGLSTGLKAFEKDSIPHNPYKK